ncbi:hypothetical protein [Picosynechococcus sp. NKBG15041c]|uniref:hypothetical protein n=1 Tax=Picosynechococcus sp. NKBG15041c TaxID=1407650 RepID=UPI00046476D6|nr:hypothetical protein [Picosynechococcus sp. NKBG15041c]
MKTAKFWFYWNDTKTLLKLKDGEQIFLSRFNWWDEGFQRRIIMFTRQQGRLILSERILTRDCDGYYDDLKTFHALIGHCPEPQWRKLDEIYNDYTAQNANY